jgi:hypothetical protein
MTFSGLLSSWGRLRGYLISSARLLWHVHNPKTPDSELAHIPYPVRPTVAERERYLASLPFAERLEAIKAEFSLS